MVVINNMCPPMACGEIIDVLLEDVNRVKLQHLSDLERERTVFEKNSSVLQHAICDAGSLQDIDICKLNFEPTKTDAVYVYGNYLSKKKNVRRAILRLNGRRCVYCMVYDASQLDHFYPKNAFPGLACDPWNLVPCCDECNIHKGSYYGPNDANEFSFMHPYSRKIIPAILSLDIEFDCVGAEESIIICKFYCKNIDQDSGVKKDQVENQLKKLDLLSRWQDYVEARTYQDLRNSIRSNMMADPFFGYESAREAIKIHVEHSMGRFFKGGDIIECNNPEYVFYRNILDDEKVLNKILNSLDDEFSE